MDRLVLVTYATRYGSTAETAQAIAQSLRDGGVAVELKPIAEVASLDAYDAVVLGAALYIGRMHKAARRFLAAHSQELAKIPVALFVPGPVETRDKDFDGARTQLDKELAKFPWLKPVACQVVGGVFDPKKMGFPLNFIPAVRKIPPSDARDSASIREWAEGLAVTLQHRPSNAEWPQERPFPSALR